MNYKILQFGIFEEQNVLVSHESKSITRTVDAAKYIKQEWEKAKKNNPTMFAGDLAGVENYDVNDNQIKINTVHTTYDDFFVSRTSDFLNTFSSEKSSNPLSVGIILVTQDEKIILGIRNQNVAIHKRSMTVPSGMIDKKDVTGKNRIDCFGAIRREILEETTVPNESLSNLCCIGLVWNESNKQTYMPFFGKTSLESNQIRKKFNDSADGEFTNLEFIPNSSPSINDALKIESISDIMKPTLEIYTKLFSKLNTE